EAAGIEKKGETVAVADGPDVAEVGETHRLPAAAVVRHRGHHERHAVGAHFADQGFQLGDVDVPLERVPRLRVLPFFDDEIDGPRSGVFDIGPRRVEVVVAGNDFAGAADKFEEDAFAGPPLMRGEHVRHAGNVFHDLFEAV